MANTTTDSIISSCNVRAEAEKTARTTEFYREWCTRDAAEESHPTPAAKEAAIAQCVKDLSNPGYNRHHVSNLEHFAEESRGACHTEEVLKLCTGKAQAEANAYRQSVEARWDSIKQQIDAFCAASHSDRKEECVAFNKREYRRFDTDIMDESQFPVGAGTFLSCRMKTMDEIKAAPSR